MTALLPWLLSFGVLVLVGAGLAIALVTVRRTRLELERRTGLVVGGSRGTSRHGVPEPEDRRVSEWSLRLGARLRAVFAFGLARSWGMRAAPPALLIAAAGGACLAWLALHSGLHMSGWVSMAGTVGAFFLTPRALLKHEQNGADQKFMESFPDTIDMVIRMLRAGVPVTGAVREVGKEAPPPVNDVFTNLADQMAIGITFEDALATAGRRVGLPDFRFFVVAVALQRATGGNLATTLDILSDIMRKRRAMRLKARATTGEVRMSAYVLGAIPFLVIGGLLVMTPDYLQPLIADPRGNVIIAMAVGSLVIGFGMIRHMMLSVTSI
ncbi:MAG TPA: type II secretion system F family protein [Acetobacteraceae bacterium]